MNYMELRNELRNYYPKISDKKADDFREHCYKILNEKSKDTDSVYKLKALQYKVITEEFTPTLFENCPFYYEMGTIHALSDGARNFRGMRHAGGWVYEKNFHLFEEYDRELYQTKEKQVTELLYLICGVYSDDTQHFNTDCRPIFAHGIKGLYKKAKSRLETADGEKKDFLEAVCEGLLCVKRISEKFSEKAYEMLKNCDDSKKRKNLLRIAESSAECPWNPPRSFYEALNTLALMRIVVGALEGVGPNTFGRVDLDLYPFYKNDIENGVITKDEAYELIAEFLIIWDMHYDHDMKFTGYSDHELENTYVLGGCDRDGNVVFNELTKMFLTANSCEKIIFPKIKCRYSSESPKEYFDLINRDIIKGCSTILYQNDDAVIPAMVNDGIELCDARDYIATGCWGITTQGKEKHRGGNYVNILKAFEYSLHNRVDKMQETKFYVKPIDGAQSFDEIYDITLSNFVELFRIRAEIVRGAVVWSKVDSFPVFSSTIYDCIEKGEDVTKCGGYYNCDNYMLVGFPNVVDSLLVIKELCFDKKFVSLDGLLSAVRANWEGCEDIRQMALSCHFWGDESAESSQLARKLNDDMHKAISSMRTALGQKILMGHLTYTEIRWWGEKTLATPDGRRNGEYFSQGLTPSRLHHIESVTSVINSMKALRRETLSANNVINIILPPNGMTLDICEAFLRCTCDSAVESLQLNCVSKETLLDARAHPEKYPDLIVRLTGFSVKFTSLSPEWQDEFISRNFYGR